MTRREWRFILALGSACIFATVAIVVGLDLLGGSYELMTLGVLLVVTVGGLGGGLAFDNYTSPPEKR